MRNTHLVLVAFAVLVASAPACAQQRSAPAGTVAHQDIPYANTDHPRQTLDLYLPQTRSSDEPLPVIVFIHGGAWRQGHKRGGRPWVVPYVRSGQFAGVSIGYRLSQHAKWPAQIHDCKAAIRWIRAHAEKHGLNANRIGVIGTSAGGHLVATLGTSGDVTELEGNLGDHTDQSSRVTCVVNYFGPSELLTMNDYPSRIDHDAADSPEALLVGGAIQQHKDAARAASPITHVNKGDAPFLSIHGTDDSLVPFNQSERLHAALGKAGVPSTLITVKGGRHGGFRNEKIRQQVTTFFEYHLLGTPAKFTDLMVDP